MKKMKKKIRKKIAIILLTIFFTGFLFSCEDDLEEYVPEPEPQEMEATIYYSGFIDYDLGHYDVYIHIWDENSKEVLMEDFPIIHSSLRKGVKTNFDHKKLPPGDYAAYAWWDLENDGLWHDYDPESEIVSFTIDGFNEASFELHLKDKVNSSDGWIEGTIICNREDYGPVYLKIRSIYLPDFSKEIKLEFDFGSWYKYDYLVEGLDEAFYDIFYFMDINNNGYQDLNEPNGSIPAWVYSAIPARVENITFD